MHIAAVSIIAAIQPGVLIFLSIGGALFAKIVVKIPKAHHIGIASVLYFRILRFIIRPIFSEDMHQLARLAREQTIIVGIV